LEIKQQKQWFKKIKNKQKEKQRRLKAKLKVKKMEFFLGNSIFSDPTKKAWNQKLTAGKFPEGC